MAEPLRKPPTETTAFETPLRVVEEAQAADQPRSEDEQPLKEPQDFYRQVTARPDVREILRRLADQ